MDLLQQHEQLLSEQKKLKELLDIISIEHHELMNTKKLIIKYHLKNEQTKRLLKNSEESRLQLEKAIVNAVEHINVLSNS